MSTVKKVGRPKYEPNDKDRLIVQLGIGHGMKQEAIARKLGMSVPTMRLYYAEEIDLGMETLELHYWSRVYKLSLLNDGTGLKAAQWALKTRFGVSEYAPRIVEPKEEKLGKKEAADRDAQVAHKDDPEWGELVDAVH